jgi:hypothetical protein
MPLRPKAALIGSTAKNGFGRYSFDSAESQVFAILLSGESKRQCVSGTCMALSYITASATQQFDLSSISLALVISYPSFPRFQIQHKQPSSLEETISRAMPESIADSTPTLASANTAASVACANAPVPTTLHTSGPFDVDSTVNGRLAADPSTREREMVEKIDRI